MATARHRFGIESSLVSSKCVENTSDNQDKDHGTKTSKWLSERIESGQCVYMAIDCKNLEISHSKRPQSEKREKFFDNLNKTLAKDSTWKRSSSDTPLLCFASCTDRGYPMCKRSTILERSSVATGWTPSVKTLIKSGNNSSGILESGSVPYYTHMAYDSANRKSQIGCNTWLCGLSDEEYQNHAVLVFSNDHTFVVPGPETKRFLRVSIREEGDVDAFEFLGHEL